MVAVTGCVVAGISGVGRSEVGLNNPLMRVTPRPNKFPSLDVQDHVGDCAVASTSKRKMKVSLLADNNVVA